MDQVNMDAWVGRALCDNGGVDLRTATQLNATLGETAGSPPAEGDTMPGLWHWCAFPPATHLQNLGADGHPRGGALLPQMHLPRRMWAGGALTFHALLRIGDRLERRSTVRNITPKQTRAGDMVLVTLDHEISNSRGLTIEERQDIVYLPIPDQYRAPQKRPLDVDAIERIETSTPLLFRFSALTFNAHRIHYDLEYTRNVEHYPDLVVHGPLQAAMLMRRATALHGRMPDTFVFRAVHPMFARGGMDIGVREAGGAMTLWTGQDGHQCMQATATWGTRA